MKDIIKISIEKLVNHFNVASLRLAIEKKRKELGLKNNLEEAEKEERSACFWMHNECNVTDYDIYYEKRDYEFFARGKLIKIRYRVAHIIEEGGTPPDRFKEFIDQVIKYSKEIS